jgi:hypothetical protein
VQYIRNVIFALLICVEYELDVWWPSRLEDTLYAELHIGNDGGAGGIVAGMAAFHIGHDSTKGKVFSTSNQTERDTSTQKV